MNFNDMSLSFDRNSTNTTYSTKRFDEFETREDSTARARLARTLEIDSCPYHQISHDRDVSIAQ